jgi:transposase InsO family protein
MAEKSDVEKPTIGDDGNSKRKTISPYDITSLDNPGLLITQVQLKGENYDEWSRSLRTALRARKKFGFVDGTITRPGEDSEDLDDWWTINSLLVSWIRNTIEPSLRSTISHVEIARDLWNDIRERFSLVNGPRIQQLKADIVECKQRGMSIVSYYGKLKQLWDELANYEQLPTCKCGGCTCDLRAVLEKNREEERVHIFLMGLEETMYGTVRSNILAQDPLPNLNKVYSILIQEERVKTISRGKDERGEVMAFAVRNRGDGKDKNMVCSHCKRTGHEAGSCFALIGYPEWWGDRSRNEGKSGGRGKGQQMSQQRTGQGVGRGRGLVRANVAQTAGEGSSLTNMAEGDGPGSLGLSNEQWEALLKLLNNQKTSEVEKMTGKHMTWIIDTGATNHMTGNLSNLYDLRNILQCPVGLPNGSNAVATKEGSVTLDGNFVLKNVLYVPGLTCNLISVSQLVDHSKCIVKFTDNICVMQDRTSRMLIGAGERRDGLYHFQGIPRIKAMKVEKVEFLDILHQRLGHPSMKVTKLIPVGGSNKNSSLNKCCDVCQRAKQTRETFSVSDFRASDVFELIHCDLWGPYRTVSSCGASYFLTIVDDYSRSVWIYLLVDKKEVPKTMNMFFSMVERQFNKQVKTVRSDNGTEFTCMKSYFFEKGIIFQTSCVGTPQQNGRVERKHQHILNVARALRFQGCLPIYFWGECVLTAGYLINRTPSSVLNGKTPYSILYGREPTYDHLRVFGSLCYAHKHGRLGDKFESRSRRCIFVGYPFGKKGWRLYDLETNEFFVSRDVKFSETEFPFASSSGDTPKLLSSVEMVDLESPEEDRLVVRGRRHVDNVPEQGSEQARELDQKEEQGVQAGELEQEEELGVQAGEGELLGRGHRQKQTSVLLRNYVTHTIQKLSPSSQTPTPRHLSGTAYPIAHYVNCNNFSLRHRTFLAAINAEREPITFSEAVKDKRWQEAMQQEIQALENNETWHIADLPPNKKALGCKWVYKIKYNSDGTVDRYKARLVILGNHQVEGIDYTETFAPVAKMTTVRVLLAVAAAKNWEVHQMDVHNAFLHGDLQEEVYMKLPPGFQVSLSGKVCKLRKSLYGLKQAPRCWFAKLSTALKAYGFQQSISDYSLFSMHRGTIHLHVLVYVDDLIVSGNNSAAIQRFKSYLSACFHMKDLGVLKYFLGVEVARGPGGFFLCQRKYALDIISEVGLLGARPASVPLEQNHRLALSTSKVLIDPEPYRRLVGRLIYLCFTRPDLSYSVHVLSQFMQQPREAHWQAALRVVRFLKRSPGQGILLSSKSELRLHGWCDADWAGCPLTRRSLTGWLVFLGVSPVSWKTKKQHTVSRSSAEAEYRSMAVTTCELKWLKGILSSLGVLHTIPMTLHCDSQAALHISQNPVFHERTKHIEVDCHFVRDAILNGVVQTKFVPSHEQLADILTKALGTRQYDYFLRKLGIRDLHAPT